MAPQVGLEHTTLRLTAEVVRTFDWACPETLKSQLYYVVADAVHSKASARCIQASGWAVFERRILITYENVHFRE